MLPFYFLKKIKSEVDTMNLKKVIATVTATAMAAAIVISPASTLTAHASEENGVFTYSYVKDKAEIDGYIAEGFAVDVTNPNNQWLNSALETLQYIGKAPVGYFEATPGYNGDTGIYTTGYNLGSSKYATNSVFSVYEPFMNTSDCPYYYIDGVSNFWAPTGLKFHADHIENFEGPDVLPSTVSEATYRAGNVSVLINEAGQEIDHFTTGTNYIINFIPLMYDPSQNGLIIRNVIEVDVMPFEECATYDPELYNTFTAAQIQQYILQEEY